MTDVMSAAKRSSLMSKIRGKNTRPELQLRRLLWRSGLRFRLHGKDIPGRPDIVLRRWRVVVLVHGCFWHHHDNCSLFRMPATNTEFWIPKLTRNRQRDAETVSELRSAGWRVAVVWECALRLDAQEAATAIASWVRDGSQFIEVFRRDESILQASVIKAP